MAVFLPRKTTGLAGTTRGFFTFSIFFFFSLHRKKKWWSWSLRRYILCKLNNSWRGKKPPHLLLLRLLLFLCLDSDLDRDLGLLFFSRLRERDLRLSRLRLRCFLWGGKRPAHLRCHYRYTTYCGISVVFIFTQYTNVWPVPGARSRPTSSSWWVLVLFAVSLVAAVVGESLAV